MTGNVDPAGYPAMIGTLRAFLDALAAAAPDAEAITALDADLAAWTARLAAAAVPERDRVFGRLRDVPGDAQAMCPSIDLTSRDGAGAAGTVAFGRWFLGANGAAHGGAVALVFDKLLGVVANAGSRAMARTAYLHVDYRSITPIETALTITASLVSSDGRKRLVRGELRDGDRLCAAAEGLFVELRPGQP